MQKFYSIENIKDIFPITATLVNSSRLYFVSYYNNILFMKDLESGIQEEILIPLEKEMEWPYRKLLSYKGKVILVPNKAIEVLLYDTSIKEFRSLLSDINGNRENLSFIDALIMDNKLFLLSTVLKGLVCIDLENTNEVKFFSLSKFLWDNIPISMKKYGEDVLIFSKGRAICHLFKTKLGIIKNINLKHSICFAEVVGDWLYYTSSSHELDAIYKFNLKTGKADKVADIKYTKPEGIRIYRFWNNVKIGEKIFFLPHETTQIVTYSLKSGLVEYINPFVEGYINRRTWGEKAVMDVISMGDNYIVIPYLGNVISVLSEKGEIIKAYEIKIQSETMKDVIMEQGATEGIVGLDEFIEYVRRKC